MSNMQTTLLVGVVFAIVVAIVFLAIKWERILASQRNNRNVQDTLSLHNHIANRLANRLASKFGELIQQLSGRDRTLHSEGGLERGARE